MSTLTKSPLRVAREAVFVEQVTQEIGRVIDQHVVKPCSAAAPRTRSQYGLVAMSLLITLLLCEISPLQRSAASRKSWLSIAPLNFGGRCSRTGVPCATARVGVR